MLRITDEIEIPEDELEERFVRASGPGGQNVNKVSTAVELRFALAKTLAISAPVRVRLRRLAGRRVTDDGVLLIRAERHRTQERNRADARERLAELVREALVEPRRRVATRPTHAAKLRRREGKARRSGVKRLRGRPGSDD